MKKPLLLLASAAMLLVGCAKEKFSPEAGDAEMVNMTVSALVQGEELTRAAVDEDGKGVYADRCIMVLYYGDQVYGRYTATVSNYKATFDVKVPAKRTYKAVFWADRAAEDGSDLYYDTADLTNITLKSDYVGNDDKRDAFFKCKEYTVENKSQSFTAELTRPFAQINVISKDIQVLRLAALYPQKVNLSFSVATSFNAMSGECGAAEAITYEADVYKAYDSAKEQLTLSMDYLFAGDRSAVDIDFKAPTEGELKVEHNFSNIPYQRNYRTNIVGNLLTADAHWDVTINHKWNEPDEEVKFVEAGSVAAANEAFANGATSVKITSVGEETTLYLPQTTNEVTIDFANPSEVVTVNYGPAPTKAAGDKPAAVNIATNDVTKFTVSGISNIVWLAGNQTALTSALNNAVAGQTVALANDIKMTENWVSVSRGSNTPNFDGRNHAISNMTITTEEDAYVGLFSTIKNHVTLQNVTFKNAKLLIPESVGEHARGGVLVGHMYPSDVINCHVEGATIVGCQKLGGLIGYIEGDAANATVTVKDCSVKDVNISSNRTGNYFEHGVGGFIGHVSLSQAHLITIENNSVENVTITGNKPMEDYNKDFLQLVPHVFIGNACQTCACSAAAVGDHKIILNNNKILGSNTVLPTCIYSSDFFGWAGNAEERPAWKGVILIDGQEWRPVFYMDADGKYHVTNLEALKYFRDMVNGNKSFEGKTVLLDADIDMAGEAWTPIGNVNSYPSISFDGIFDGQNHTIDNLSCTDNTQNYACAALFGSIYGTIQNLKLTNVNINSTHYAAAIAAYSSSSESKIINCSVIDGTITSTPEWLSSVFDNGDKAGAIMGLNAEGGTVDNCYVEGVTVTAYRDLGAIVGAGGVNKTTNNKAKNCTLIVDRTNFYGDEAVNAAPIVGRNLGGTLNTNNTAENVTISIPANTADAIRAAVKSVNAATSAGAYTITIADGTYELSDIAIAENAKNKSVTIKAAAKGGVTLKMNSDTKSKQIFLVDGYSGNNPTYSLIIDGIKFDLTQVTSGSAAPVYAFQAGDSIAGQIGYTTAGPNLRYAHHITIQNCELKGAAENSMMFYSQGNTSPNNIVVKDCSIANVGYLFNGYCDTFTAIGVTATNVKHFINNQGNGIVAENCKVDCYTDYAVRSNGGPVSITNSAFTMTYTGTDMGGIYVDRGDNTVITMNGNTYPEHGYDGANMHDVYKASGSDCTINGTIMLSAGESYDFPRD